jgi:hypothetical protein
MSETNNTPNKKKFPTRLAAGIAGAIGGIAFFHGMQHDSEAPKPEPTGTVEVQPGQTFSEVAEQVAISTPEKETMQEAAENMREINTLPRYPEVAPGQELQVPASADVNLDQEGIQLAQPDAGTPTPPEDIVMEEGHAGVANTGMNPEPGEIEEIPHQ